MNLGTPDNCEFQRSNRSAMLPFILNKELLTYVLEQMGQQLTRTPKIQLISISASHLLVHFISVTALQKYDVEFPHKR